MSGIPLRLLGCFRLDTTPVFPVSAFEARGTKDEVRSDCRGSGVDMKGTQYQEGLEEVERSAGRVCFLSGNKHGRSCILMALRAGFGIRETLMNMTRNGW